MPSLQYVNPPNLSTPTPHNFLNKWPHDNKKTKIGPHAHVEHSICIYTKLKIQKRTTSFRNRASQVHALPSNNLANISTCTVNMYIGSSIKSCKAMGHTSPNSNNVHQPPHHSDQASRPDSCRTPSLLCHLHHHLQQQPPPPPLSKKKKKKKNAVPNGIRTSPSFERSCPIQTF